MTLDPEQLRQAMRAWTTGITIVTAIHEGQRYGMTVMDCCDNCYAGKIPDIEDRFAGVLTETLLIDAPLLKGGMAYFNCRVMNSMPIGENTLFIAEVVAAQSSDEGAPLVYHNRVFWKLVK